MVLLWLVIIDKLYSSLFEEQTRAKLVNVLRKQEVDKIPFGSLCLLL